jgi:TolA-binding protein
MRFRFAVPLAAVAAVAAVPAFQASAQRQPPSPEQRLERLERQVEQVQRRVFDRGRPADTAGFAYEPAATQASVQGVSDRIGALERQLADILRQTEENGHRTRQLESELSRLRTDQEQRIAALEAAARAAAAAPVPADSAPAATTTAGERPRPLVSSTPPAPAATAATGTAEADPAEAAYDEGYQLWRAGRYDEAISSLRAFVSAYPRHRRASWASNLAGRALLDKGQPRAAAEALLANYRSNPSGERAADSLFYLGQALLKLGQPAQACKAYEELEQVYGARMRDELKRLLPPAKTEASCS